MNTISKILDNDIIISEVNNKIEMSINIDIASKIDFNKQDLWFFSEEKGEFIKTNPKIITHIGFSSISKKKVKDSDLNFLTKYFSHITSVTINCCCNSITQLYNLENLEKIVIYNKIDEHFDFSLFSSLREVFVYYQKSLNSIFDCTNLCKLEIHKYSNRTFEQFKRLEALESLIIRQGNLSDILNINDLKKLVDVEISHNRSLTDLNPLSNNNNIKRLILDSCSKIRNFNPISEMKKLQHLTLENLKEIETLDFVKKATNLKRIGIIGRSNVLDGKLNWLLKNKKIELISEARKHYDIKWEQTENGDHILVSKK
ncbi:hypothetical protein [Tenacibaculum soleae]|uniref:hypothetical protein n=1 Tax=Tenacibaculum soleae TaxID=447689 RepID=UPI0022FFEE22|nr:hypothetical protein [Tenacibaculum soleae]